MSFDRLRANGDEAVFKVMELKTRGRGNLAPTLFTVLKHPRVFIIGGDESPS
jgi:hypothetical protein